MLERRAVALAHEEADQPLVALAHLSEATLNETRAALTTARSDANAPSSARKPWSSTSTCSRGLASTVNGHGAASDPSPRRPDVPYWRRERSASAPPGWSYPSWRPGFYPEGTKPEEFLRFYAERFDTVELNTTGYRLPAEEQFRRWADAVPDGFRFAPKLALRAARPARPSRSSARALGDRLGPVRVVVESPRDDGLLAYMLGSVDPALELAFDFRHESWAGVEGVVTVNDLGAEPFRYVRLREPPYSDDDLRALAATLAAGVRLLPPRGRADGARLRRAAARAHRRAACVTGGDARLRRRLRVDEHRGREQHRDRDDALAGDAAAHARP